MELTSSILKDIRDSLDLDPAGKEFNSDILMNINAALITLNQNGVGNLTVVNDESTTWKDLENPEQEEGNKSFQLVPMYVRLYTKIIFDPPPPSAVETFNIRMHELLWRLKIAYELGGVTE